MPALGTYLAILSFIMFAMQPLSATSLTHAYEQPERVLRDGITMRISPDATSSKKIPLSLQDAILLLLRYNPSVQNREIDRVVQRYDLRVAQNEFELQYALSGDANYNRTRLAGIPIPDTTTGNLKPEVSLKTGIGTKIGLGAGVSTDFHDTAVPLTFSLTQPLLRGFGTAVTKRGLNDSYDNEIINQLNLKNGVIGDVTKVVNDYRQTISANNVIVIQRQSLADAMKTFDNNKAKIKAGQLEASANVQQSAQVEQLRLTLATSINGAEETKQRLLQDIGLDPMINIQVPSDVDIGQPKAPDPNQMIQFAIDNNLNYQAALVSFRQTERALVVAQDNLRWRLDVSASSTVGSSSLESPDTGFNGLVNARTRAQNVGLSLVVPINDMSSKRNAIAAKLAVEKARINLAAAKRELITNVRNQTRNIQSQIDQIKIAKRSLELANLSYELEKKKRSAGIASSLDVTNSQNQLINARISLINSKISYLNSVTTLNATIGTTLDEYKIKLKV